MSVIVEWEPIGFYLKKKRNKNILNKIGAKTEMGSNGSQNSALNGHSIGLFSILTTMNLLSL